MPGAGGSASLLLINETRSHGSPLNKGRHGRGLRFFLHRLRLRLAPGCALWKNSTSSFSHNRRSSLRPAMRAFKTRAKHPKTRDASSARDGSGDNTDPAPPPQDDATPSMQPGLFTRMLRRAKSKTNLKTPLSRSSSSATYPAIPERHEAADSVPTPEQLAYMRPAKASRSLRFTSDSPKPTVENNQMAEAYAPKSSASDLPQAARDVTARNRSQDEDRRQLSSPQATSSLPLGINDDRQHNSASEGPGDERPTTAASGDTLDEPTEVNGGRSNSESRQQKTYLQAPPAPSQRQQHTMHSYKSTTTDLGMAPEGSSSDYQQFVQQAKSVEEREQEELWKTISSRSKQKNFVPNHPDFNMNLSSLERSGTFGGAKKSPPKAKKSGSMWKRTSVAVQRAPADDKRRSYTVGSETLSTDLLPGSRSGDPGRKMSVTRPA